MDSEDWLPSEIKRLHQCEDSDEVADYIQKLLLRTKTFSYVFRLRTRLAILYRHQKKYELAIEQHTILIERDADEPVSYYNRGIVYDDISDFEKARADFEKAIELLDHEEDFSYFYNLGMVCGKLEDTATALHCFTTCIRLDATDALAYYQRACIHLMMDQEEAALADLNTSLELDSSNDHLFFKRADLYYDLEQYELAIQDFNAAIALKETHAPYYNDRGICYKALQLFEQARADYNKAIELRSSWSIPYYNRGSLYLEEEQYELAIQDFNTAIELNDENPLHYHKRGLAYQRIGHWTMATQDYYRCLELEPTRAIIYYNMMDHYLGRGEHNWALQVCRQLIEKDPDDSEHYIQMASILLKVKRYVEMEPFLQHVIDTDANHAEAYNMMGLTHYRQGHFKQALLYYNRAIELAPTTELYFRNRALVYKYMNKPIEAAKDRLIADRLRRYRHLSPVSDHPTE